MAFGYIDTTYVDLPAGIDSGYLQGLQTRSGLSVAEMIRSVDAAMGAINGGADPLVAALTFPTTAETAGIRGTGTKTVKRRGEYVMGRPQQIGPRVGHMLPVATYEIDTGFTEDGLEEISTESFNAELDAIVEAYRRFHLSETLVRLTSAAEVAVDPGKTTVVSPGFAGSGTGTNVFGGQFPSGDTIPGGYTHYGFSTIANLATLIATALTTLKRWHRPPFDLVASSLLLADVVALPLFVATGSALVRPPAANAEALVDATEFIGVLNGEIRVHYAVDAYGTTRNGTIYKSYGAFSTSNPLAWRYDPLWGRDARVRSRALYPLADAMTMQRLGFGVADRTAAYNMFVDNAAGAYVAPTITI